MRSNFNTKMADGTNKRQDPELLVNFSNSFKGELIAVTIIFLWVSSLAFFLTAQLSVLTIAVGILIQTHLYTGIFITAHDAIHGIITRRKKINKFLGFTCATVFAFNNYNILLKNHHLHHRYPGTTDDPDFYNGGFFPWYFKFLKQYITWQQILLMAISFNILKILFNESSLLIFWALPSILSTFQLFYFGTYFPHKEPHIENVHKARSQKKNHVYAFLTCYFFGYHYEHHEKPYIPWWLLHKLK